MTLADKDGVSAIRKQIEQLDLAHRQLIENNAKPEAIEARIEELEKFRKR